MNFTRTYAQLRNLIDDIAAKVGGVAAQVAASGNSATFQNGAGTPAAAPLIFDSGIPFVSKTGKIRIRASLSATGTGGTSVAGEQIQFQLRAGGAVIATGPTMFVEVGATHLDAGATLVFTLPGQPVGGAGQTYGIQAVNVTTGAHTLASPADGALVEVQDAL